jgi:hypothetical protein
MAQYDAEKGAYVAPVEPVWTLKSAYWWRMVFPANGSVSVHHEYTPAVGGTVGVFFPRQCGARGGIRGQILHDDGFLRAGAEAAAGRRGGARRDRLHRALALLRADDGRQLGRLDQEFPADPRQGLGPKNLVSFCGEGVKKIGPTTFAMEKIGILAGTRPRHPVRDGRGALNSFHPIISAIVAVSKNGVIGRDGDMPWRSFLRPEALQAR